MNFLKVGEPESAYLIITLRNGKDIELSFDEGTMFLGIQTNKQQDINNLIDLYNFLLEKTFDNRLNFYLRQAREKGYFEYDKCRFYLGDKIVFRSKEFPVKSSSFLKSNGAVEMRKSNCGFLDRIKRELSLTKIPQFNVQTDADVILHILDKHFGLRWET